MSRNPLILAGGSLGAIRGGAGILFALVNLPSAGTVDSIAPGASTLIVLEILFSVGILAMSIWALVKANDPKAAILITVWAVVMVALAVIDAIAAQALFTNTPLADSTSFASVSVPLLIGLLLFTGARQLGREPKSQVRESPDLSTEATSPDAP